MRLRERQHIFTYNVACLIHYAFDSCNIKLTFGEVHRTWSQVLLNYFGYKIEKGGLLGIKLVKSRRLSRTLRSLHQDRLAVDFNFFIDGQLTYDFDKIKPLGDYWETLHPDNRWGGDFNQDDIKNGFVDVPHFEMRKG
ncbi:M15 family metallopeptidase [Flavobacteriaceae bacterium GF1]